MASGPRRTKVTDLAACDPLQAEIQAEVRAVLSTLPEVWGCSHIHLLWDAARGGTLVQANVIMDPSMRVLQAMRIGGETAWSKRPPRWGHSWPATTGSSGCI